MRYKLTEGTELRIRDLLRLIRETRPCLAAADPSIRSEWDRLRGRFPSEHDAREGYTSLSDIELEDLRSKVQRLVPLARPQAAEAEQAPAQLAQVSSTDWQRTASMAG